MHAQKKIFFRLIQKIKKISEWKLGHTQHKFSLIFNKGAKTQMYAVHPMQDHIISNNFIKN